jgi:hypothetical protein
LSQIIGNFSTATTDTKNFPRVFDDIQILIQVFNNGSYTFPVWYAEEAFYGLLNEFSAQLNNIAGFLLSTKSNVNLLKSGNFAITSENALKYLPSPLMIEIWLEKLYKVASKYADFVSSIVKDMTQVYNIFKSTNPTFLSIEKTANLSLMAAENRGGKVTDAVLAVLEDYYGNLTGIYQSYLGIIPQSLVQNPQFAAKFLLDDGKIQDLNRSVVEMRGQVKITIEGNYTKPSKFLINNYYQNELMGYATTARARMFTQFQRNITSLKCSEKLTSSAEGAIKKFGGPTALFNCTDNTYGTMLSSVQENILNILNGANSYLTTMEQCLNVLSDVLDDVTLLDECITSVSIE